MKKIEKSSREKAKEKAARFHKEVKKSILTAIVAAFSFLIALAWKELITEWVGLLTAISPISGKVIEVFVITVICVAGILLVTRFLGEQ